MLRRILLSLLLPVAVLSCDDSTGPIEVVGFWRLQTVSGQPIPYVLEQQGTRKVELTGETVEFLATGRQTMVTSFRVTEGTNVFTESIPAPGDYTVNGSTVVLSFDDDPSTYTAIVKDDRMTIEDIGLTFVYRRD